MQLPFVSLASQRQTLLIEHLQDALPGQELSLAYQPLVDLHTGRIRGAQALPSWTSTALGVVHAAERTGAAVRCELIHPLGEWALQEVCRQIAAWRARGLRAFRVALNVSPVQLSRPQFSSSVGRALKDHGLTGECLALEISETALMEHFSQTCASLFALQADGIEVWLDDFGTGHSSLSRLRDLPIDLVKIDRSFIDDMINGPAGVSLTRSIIALAHGLHLRVLAKGVETEWQLRTLLDHGCDDLQGRYFSEAMDPDRLAVMMDQSRQLPEELTLVHRRARTLLLVDDESHVLSALRRLFRRDGYVVLAASTAKEALAHLASHSVDVILADHRMPGMTGVEFLRQAKTLYPDVVRMTLSGYTDLQSIIEAVNEGAVYRFLTKPWDDVELRLHVQAAFRHQELLEENRRLERRVIQAGIDLGQANRRLSALLNRQREQNQRVRVSADQTDQFSSGPDDEGSA